MVQRILPLLIRPLEVGWQGYVGGSILGVVKTEPEISRRGTLKVAAWAMPVIAVASATPAAAASATSTWTFTGTQARFVAEPTGGDFPIDFDGFTIYVRFDLARSDGGEITSDGSVALATDADDASVWYFNAGGTSKHASTRFSGGMYDELKSLDATTLTLTIDGEVHGPYPIDRSALTSP